MPPERELVDGTGVYVTVFTNLEMVTAAPGTLQERVIHCSLAV
jgi:hypothetical protein